VYFEDAPAGVVRADGEIECGEIASEKSQVSFDNRHQHSVQCEQRGIGENLFSTRHPCLVLMS
jgi:hypothetical protein